MNKLLLFLLLAAFLTPFKAFAQLPDGAIAPNWTHTDIEGNTHNLYDLLDEGKMVVLKFSATWCGPCWNYLNTGALEDFWEEHGPNGTDQGQVFYVESDFNTGMDDLLGETSESQGNWVAAIPFPIIDLQPGENTAGQYQISYYPTLYAVCSDRKIYELGQVPASEWEEFLTSCTLSGAVANVEDALCFGDGSISLDVTGGVSPIDYEWSNGEDTPTLENLGAGIYSVTVTEANGKDFVIEDIVITGAENPISLAQSEIEPALCFESSTGAVNIELADGVEPYDYSWSNGAQTQNLTGVPAGTYEVVATDDNGCTFEDIFEVGEPEELVAEYSTTPDYCEQANGTASFDIEGGVGNYSMFSSEGSVEGDQLVDLPGGIITVTIEDGNGCVWEENIEIEGEPEHSVFFSPEATLTCVQPTATVTGYVQGGSSDYEFQWSTSNGNIVGPTTQSSITVDQDGDYDLVVIDLFTGCVVESTTEVDSDIVPPAVSAGDDTPITCESLILELQGSGDPSNTIVWSTADGNIVSGGDTYVPTIDAPGTYIIHVTNPGTACTNVDTVTVDNGTDPAAADYQYQTSGLTVIGTDQSTGSNLTGYSWTFGDGNISTEQNAVHTYAAEGVYEVCHSVQNGCGSSSTCYQVEVVAEGSSISVLAEIQHVLCNAGSDGSINIQVNGGTGIYTYVWTGPGGQVYTDPSIDSLPAGVYQLVVSDDEGSLFIGEYTITEPSAITLVGSTIVDNLCFGSAAGSVAVEITGGVGPYQYAFNNAPFQTDNFITNLPAGVIEGVVMDGNGCLFTAGPYTIQQPDSLYVTNLVSTDADNLELNNGSITLDVIGGVAPYLVTWSNGATGTTIDGLVPGEYTYTVVDANGCVINEATPIIIGSIVSTSSADWSQFVSIAPNPSKGDIIVSWQGLQVENGVLTLVTAQGKRLHSRRISEGSGTWDLSGAGLSSGMYIVLLEMKGDAVPFKLIVL